MIDVLALSIDKSIDRVKTLNIIAYAFGVGTFRSFDEVINSRDASKEFNYLR